MLSGCGVPLAPGYQVQKEILGVHFIPGHPPHLAVDTEYRLANSGSTPLHFFDVVLPSASGFGSENLHAEVDGKEVAPQEKSAVDSAYRVPLPSEWRKKAKITLRISYDLAASPAADARILVGAKMFYLNDSGWFPAFLPFKAFLAPQVSRPHAIDFNLMVPGNFRATASGRPQGQKERAGEIEYRFRIGKKDFDPYVIAGAYNEQRVSTPTGAVVIWTFKPISPLQAQKTASSIATAARFDSQTFGPLPRSMKAIYDVELPRDIPDLAGWQGFLPGVIYNEVFETKKSFWTGLNDAVLDVSTPMQLGYTWFGHMIRPRPEAWSLGTGLTAYSTNVLAESGATGTSRNSGIGTLLDNYDNARAEAVEKPILSLKSADPEDQVRLGFEKMELFFFALEDKCGQQNVTHAIAHMVYALRGGEYGYPEFRSALELQCHQDLAGFFRVWLAQPGIPPDFRARYENATGNKQPNPQ